MVSWLFFASTCFLAIYTWRLKRDYEKKLGIADDGARIGRSAFENTALGMAIVSPDLNYIHINKAYCEIVGYSRAELCSMIHKDFIHPEDSELDTPLLMDLNAGLDLIYQGSKIKITGSFGIAYYDWKSNDSTDQLISKADQAMYRAKNHKNTVYHWVC